MVTPAASRRHASDPLRALLALRELPARRVVGLMSGTSADGTDAALVELAGSGESTRVRLLSYVSVPFPRALRERIFGLAEADASELSELDVLIGESFAQADRRRLRQGRHAPVGGPPHRLARADRQPPPPLGRASWARPCRSGRRRSSPSGPGCR